MKRVYFRCTFLSDIILNAYTATEGHAQSLDYIPGSNFLGIVAKSYNEFQNCAFKIFHSGQVRFADGHLSLENQRSIKIPLAWFTIKGQSYHKENYLNIQKIWLHHAPDKPEEQLKQIRKGFFTLNGFLPTVEHIFSIKSGYDSTKRRAHDSQLYGYDALAKGSVWIFYVDFDDTVEEKWQDLVCNKLQGEHFLGRSRGSEYGKVHIERISDIPEFPQDLQKITAETDQLFLYAESSWAFFDAYGSPTFQPSLEDLKLDSSCRIDWTLSQIQTRIFAPWNHVRKYRDHDRVCIDKGSVLVICVPKNFDVASYQQRVKLGIGVYRNEGMGQVLVNPCFLQSDQGHPKIQVNKDTISKIRNIDKFSSVQDHDKLSDEKLTVWLEQKIKKDKNEKFILDAVNKFLQENKKRFETEITSSQWGSILAIATSSSDYKTMCESLFRDPKETFVQGKKHKEDNGGFLRHGTLEKAWKKRYSILQKAIEEVQKETKSEECARVFTIKLCSEMAKFASKPKGVK